MASSTLLRRSASLLPGPAPGGHLEVLTERREPDVLLRAVAVGCDGTQLTPEILRDKQRGTDRAVMQPGLAWLPLLYYCFVVLYRQAAAPFGKS